MRRAPECGWGHPGFMLCPPRFDQPSGDCAFMPLPAQHGLFDIPAAELLFARREAHWVACARFTDA